MVWILHCIDALFQSSQVRFSNKILHLPFGPRLIAEIVVLVHLTDMHLQAFQAPGKSKRATWATSQHWGWSLDRDGFKCWNVKKPWEM